VSFESGFANARTSKQEYFSIMTKMLSTFPKVFEYTGLSRHIRTRELFEFDVDEVTEHLCLEVSVNEWHFVEFVQEPMAVGPKREPSEVPKTEWFGNG
jgi:hypothetical protein